MTQLPESIFRRREFVFHCNIFPSTLRIEIFFSFEKIFIFLCFKCAHLVKHLVSSLQIQRQQSIQTTSQRKKYRFLNAHCDGFVWLGGEQVTKCKIRTQVGKMFRYIVTLMPSSQHRALINNSKISILQLCPIT